MMRAGVVDHSAVVADRNELFLLIRDVILNLTVVKRAAIFLVNQVDHVARRGTLRRLLLLLLVHRRLARGDVAFSWRLGAHVVTEHLLRHASLNGADGLFILSCILFSTSDGADTWVRLRRLLAHRHQVVVAVSERTLAATSFLSALRARHATLLNRRLVDVQRLRTSSSSDGVVAIDILAQLILQVHTHLVVKLVLGSEDLRDQDGVLALTN